MQKLRLAHAKEGLRINEKGPRLYAATVTHEQAQEFSNQGHAKWFVWCDAANHPNESERIAETPAPIPTVWPKPERDKPKQPGPEKLVPPTNDTIGE